MRTPTTGPETVTVTDAFGAVLDSREVKAFDTGKYRVWKVSGHVIIRHYRRVRGRRRLERAVLRVDGAAASRPVE